MSKAPMDKQRMRAMLQEKRQQLHQKSLGLSQSSRRRRSKGKTKFLHRTSSRLRVSAKPFVPRSYLLTGELKTCKVAERKVPQNPPAATKQVEVLTSIDKLLDMVPPRSLVAFDIDETLIITKASPSQLLTPEGVKSFQAYVRVNCHDFATKNLHCRNLQRALRAKELLEPCTAKTIKELQRRGCKVFAVTARYREMATHTVQTLRSLGIDFSRSSPFPDQVLQDPQTEALLTEGVLYCNGLEKGFVLDRFLANYVLSAPLARTLHWQECMAKEGKRPSAAPRTPPYPALFFVDDMKAHSDSMLTRLECVRRLGIPVFAYHFVPPRTKKKKTAVESNLLLLAQMERFVASNGAELLTDEQAVRHVKEKETAAANPTDATV